VIGPGAITNQLSLIIIHILISWGGKIAPLGAKARNPKIQHPKKLQASIPQSRHRATRLWDLLFDVSLDVGAWNLELPSALER
jgi:hypothetical protein